MKMWEMIMIVLTIAGALEVSYVESIIISQSEYGLCRGKKLRQIYWSDLSKKNRWLYWTGVICLVSPFTFTILQNSAY